MPCSAPRSSTTDGTRSPKPRSTWPGRESPCGAPAATSNVNDMSFPALRHPIIQAPLAGGPSTPELAAAVSAAGGLGFIAAGYLAPDALREQIERARALTTEPFGVNMFHLTETPVDDEQLAAYVRRLQSDPAAAGASLGRPRFED